MHGHLARCNINCLHHHHHHHDRKRHLCSRKCCYEYYSKNWDVCPSSIHGTISSISKPSNPQGNHYSFRRLTVLPKFYNPQRWIVIMTILVLGIASGPLTVNPLFATLLPILFGSKSYSISNCDNHGYF